MKRLRRSKTNVVISGTCAGIGEYFNVDPEVIRLLTCIAIPFSGGLAIAVYAILWVFMSIDYND